MASSGRLDGRVAVPPPVKAALEVLMTLGEAVPSKPAAAALLLLGRLAKAGVIWHRLLARCTGPLVKQA